MPPFGKKPAAAPVTPPTAAEVRTFDLAKAAGFARGVGRRSPKMAIGHSEEHLLVQILAVADDQLVISSAILLELAAMNDRAAS